MSYNNFKIAMSLIYGNVKLCESIRPQIEVNIAQAESLLKISFPNSYKEFLKQIGRLNLGSVDVFGLTFNRYSEYITNDVVCETIELRKANYDSVFSLQLIPIYDLGNGEIFCLDTSQMNEEGECSVVAWYFGRVEKIAEDFGEFLLEKVVLALESLEKDGKQVNWLDIDKSKI